MTPEILQLLVYMTIFVLIVTTVMKIGVGLSYYLAWRYTKSLTVKSLVWYFMSTAANTMLLVKLIVDNAQQYPPRDIIYLMAITGTVFVATFNIFNTIWIKRDPSHITNRIDPAGIASKINKET